MEYPHDVSDVARANWASAFTYPCEKCGRPVKVISGWNYKGCDRKNPDVGLPISEFCPKCRTRD